MENMKHMKTFENKQKIQKNIVQNKKCKNGKNWDTENRDWREKIVWGKEGREF